MTDYPDAELVAVAWLNSIPGIQLDYADWRFPWDIEISNDNKYGYLQVTVTGGAPDVNAPYFRSAVQVDAWVASPSEDRQYRLQASKLIKQVQYACLDRKSVKRGVTPVERFPDGTVYLYPAAHVESVYCLSEPHRMQSKDNALYEGYSADFMFTWTTGMQVN